MEVEVKLKLPDAAAHQEVSRLLAPFRLATHLQENVFFDGSDGELSGARAVLRLRFYDGDSRCVVSLKGKAVIVDGISRVEEVEEDVDPALGRACVAETWRLAALECGIVKRVLAEYGCKGFVCLRGFRNVRGVFDWRGLKIELDETHYDFGTCYEIECESDDPERVKKVLEDFLGENGVPFSHSVKSKFAIFRFELVHYKSTNVKYAKSFGPILGVWGGCWWGKSSIYIMQLVWDQDVRRDYTIEIPSG